MYELLTRVADIDDAGNAEVIALKVNIAAEAAIAAESMEPEVIVEALSTIRKDIEKLTKL